MTQPLQSGQHPDADQLSAFAEHALPPHEQQQTLAHLAECSDCRAIVFLAQQPNLAEAAQPRPVAARPPWLSAWNLALPAALALAALVLITIHISKRSESAHPATAVNTARVEQPSTPAPSSSTAAARSVPAPILTPPAAQHPATIMVPKPIPAAPMLQENLSNESRTVAQPGVINGVIAGGLGGQPRQTLPGPSVSTNSIAPTIAPQQAALGSAETTRREFRSSASQYNGPPAAAPASTGLNQAYQEAPPPPPPAAPASANESITVTTASAVLDANAADSSQVIESETYSSLPLALKAKKQPSLPSHLPTVSTIASARQVLAIDTAGALFRSNDAGVTWQPVAAQWKGRAVKLQLSAQPEVRQLAKVADSVAGLSAAKAAPAAPTQPTFELTTDADGTWTSTDGQTWKHK